MTDQKTPVLEPAAQAFAEATAGPPFTFELPADVSRKGLEDLQSGNDLKLDADIIDLTVDTGQTGTVKIRIVRPPNSAGPLPVLLYTHGAGWVLGSPDTHERLARDLAVGANVAVVLPHYDRSPEVKYPTALEQCWAVAEWIRTQGSDHNLDPSSIVIGGDSCGGNMAAALTLLAKQRGGVNFAAQVLFYPVTNANFDTGSYLQFQEGYFLRRDNMMWFWDQYAPDPAQRDAITVAPLKATLDDLADLPPALIINGEADVLRDEGEAYGDQLRAAGVPVTAARYAGMIHDFVMLDTLRTTNAAEAAIAQACAFISSAVWR
ncbi:alpha/beta hydrolase [Nocardioides sp.]|uniref:alpha/beta hydrolase n=1 Tax=Nocardioides sp. TaxID=35761 RepID=UPI0031FE8457|nr:Alpha/beta hydrolase fold-3 domain protein [Nocardioides sp.]